jgi:aryl-alcohol dehydrogenase-like predicted oxidoreductase
VKLALGTVQFGLDYGAFGDSARPSSDAIFATLDQAYAAGIAMLDTAAAYGNSEVVLGELAAAERFTIVTKIPSLKDCADPYATASKHIANSLSHLKTDSIYGVMTHSVDDLLGVNGNEIWRAMSAAKQAGKVERIGASVYSPEQADAITRRYPIEIIQLPFNVFDQRALQTGLFDRLKHLGVEIHVRSVFLQGLLLSEIAQLPAALNVAAPLLASFRSQCSAMGCSPLTAALAFVRQQEAIDKIVVGVRNTEELAGILTAWQAEPILPDLSALASTDLQLIDPSNWSTL